MKAAGCSGSSGKSFLKGRIDSFRNAVNGIGIIITGEKNFRIHLIVLAAVIVAGILFRLKAGEWIAVVLASGLVLSCECLNSAIEYLGDAVSEQENINLKKAKDASAAGVLIAAIISIITGIIVFVSAIIRFFKV